VAGVTLGLLAGCPSGIGPEVLAAALVKAKLPADARCVFFGPPQVLLLGASLSGVDASVMSDQGKSWGSRVLLEQGNDKIFVDCEERADLALQRANPGQPDDEGLAFQKNALLVAIEAASEGRVDALVTGPIRKKAIADVAGERFAGQTELLHHFLAADDAGPLMCFAGGPFVMGLVTAHVPLKDVSAHITERRVVTCLSRLHDATRAVLDNDNPRLALLGVNPHAGERGLIGDEELEVLLPAIEFGRGRGADLVGPLPADGFFAQVSRMDLMDLPHGVLAMHHDQGLAPYKMLAKGRGVNFTWGLSVPRTSPDHGTADDLAGTGDADSSSMRAAIELACKLAQTRAT
jgi:4-hydroxythreonine-4-phosphate dehydrogenase